MTGSPRTLLKAALDSLDQLTDLLDRSSEIKEDLEATIGVERFAGVVAARQEIGQAVEMLDSAAPVHDSVVPE